MTSAANCGEYLHHCTVVLTTTEWYKKVTTQITHCCLLYSHGRSCSPAVHPSPYSSSPHAGQKTRDVGYNVTIPFVIPAKQNDTARPQAPKILHCCVHCLLLSAKCCLPSTPSLLSGPHLGLLQAVASDFKWQQDILDPGTDWHWETLHCSGGSEVSGHFGTRTEVSKRHFGPKYRTVPPHGPKCPAIWTEVSHPMVRRSSP